MANVTNEDLGELVKGFEPFLIQKLMPTEIFKTSAISRLKLTKFVWELRELQKRSTTEAAQRFLNILHDDCKASGKYISFVEALEQYGYTWACIFRGEHRDVEGEGRSLLEHHVDQHWGDFMQDVKPSEIVTVLKAEDCFTSEQCEEILKEEKNTSCGAAMTKLLEYLRKCKKSDRWVTYLMLALVKSGYEHLVEKIFPNDQDAILSGTACLCENMARKVDEFASKQAKMGPEKGVRRSARLQERALAAKDNARPCPEGGIDIMYKEEGLRNLPEQENPNASGLPRKAGNPPVTSGSAMSSTRAPSSLPSPSHASPAPPASFPHLSESRNPERVSQPNQSASRAHGHANSPSQSACLAPQHTYNLRPSTIATRTPGYYSQQSDDASSIFSANLTVTESDVRGSTLSGRGLSEVGSPTAPVERIHYESSSPNIVIEPGCVTETLVQGESFQGIFYQEI